MSVDVVMVLSIYEAVYRHWNVIVGYLLANQFNSKFMSAYQSSNESSSLQLHHLTILLLTDANQFQNRRQPAVWALNEMMAPESLSVIFKWRCDLWLCKIDPISFLVRFVAHGCNCSKFQWRFEGFWVLPRHRLEVCGRNGGNCV